MCSGPRAEITVAIGRFDRLLSRGIIDALQNDPQIQVPADGLDGPGLVRAVADRSVQAAVLDATAVGSVAAELRAVRPDVGLLALVPEPTLTYGTRLLAWGASCLDWDASPLELSAAIRLAVAGGCLFASRGHRVERIDAAAGERLTEREEAVLSYLIEGVSYERIARELGITVRTVKAHTNNLRCKLKAQSRRDFLGLPQLVHP